MLKEGKITMSIIVCETTVVNASMKLTGECRVSKST